MVRMARGTERFGIFRLARSHCYDLGPDKAEDDKCQRHPDAEPAVRQEAAMRVKICQADRLPLMHAEKDSCTQHDEDADGASP